MSVQNEEVRTMVGRIERLEARTRRLALVSFAALACTLALAAWTWSAARALSRVVGPHSLTLTDEAGRTRISLYASKSSSALVLDGARGEPGVSVSVTAGIPSIELGADPGSGLSLQVFPHVGPDLMLSRGGKAEVELEANPVFSGVSVGSDPEQQGMLSVGSQNGRADLSFFRAGRKQPFWSAP